MTFEASGNVVGCDLKGQDTICITRSKVPSNDFMELNDLLFPSIRNSECYYMLLR
jgi:hypothetical protein